MPRPIRHSATRFLAFIMVFTLGALPALPQALTAAPRDAALVDPAQGRPSGPMLEGLLGLSPGWSARLTAPVVGAHSATIESGPEFESNLALLEAGSRTSTVTSGDFDRNGTQDLAAATSRGISVWLGRGDGTFGDMREFALEHPGPWVRAADVDRDGKEDLVVVGADAALCTVLRGRGDGSFEFLGSFGTGQLIGLADLGDVDGDGWLDLAAVVLDEGVGLRGGSVTLLFGSGGGRFGDQVLIPGTKWSVGICIGDLTGDGRPDLATTNFGEPVGSQFGEGSVVLLVNGGGRVFERLAPIPAGNIPQGLTIAKLNGDQHPDLAVAVMGGWGSASGGVTVFYGRGDGRFDRSERPVQGNGQMFVIRGDLNGDGRDDLIWRHGQEIAGVLLGRPGGRLESTEYCYLKHSPSWPVLMDLDGDGVLDIASATGESAVGVALGNGDGTFGRARRLLDNCGLDSPVAADFDGDGHTDLAGLCMPPFAGGGGPAVVLLGTGDGRVRARVDIPIAEGANALAVEDMNRDGSPDLVLAGGGFVSIVPGRGDGSFGPEVRFPGWGPAIAVGDLNGDGWPDVATSQSMGFSICEGDRDDPDFHCLPPTYFARVYFNHGGNLSAPVEIRTGNTAHAGIAIEDLDADGREDLVVASIDYFDGSGDNFIRVEPRVSVFYAFGDSLPGDSIFTEILSRPSGVALADVVGDAKPDIVMPVTSGGAKGVLILPSEGRARLGSQIHIPTSGYPSSIALCDLDHDSDLDILLSAGDILWLRNEGGGDFELAGRWGVGLQPRGLVVTDLTGDGWADLVSGGTYAVNREYRPGLWLLPSRAPAESPLAARMDIRPGSCPSPLQPGARGVLPVAVLGAAGFDVRDIDPSTLRLEGARPVRHEYRDALTPVRDAACECGLEAPDGAEDLVLAFDVEAVTRSLPTRVRRAETQLSLTGRLWNGRAFEAHDCVTIVGGPGRPALEPLGAPRAAAQAARYEVTQRGTVRLEVFDIQGRQVRRLVDEVGEPGVHEAHWDATGLPSGLYFYRLCTLTGTSVAKVVLAR